MRRYVRFACHAALAGAVVVAAAACKDSTGPADTTAPLVQIQTPANGFATALNNVTVSGTATDAVGVTRVTYQLDGGAETEVSITAGKSVGFSFGAALTQASSTVVVNAYDRAGNRSSATVAGTLDQVAPALQVNSLSTSNVVIEPTVSVDGTVSDAGRVTRLTYRANGGAETDVPITSGTSVSFSFPVSLAAGVNTVVVSAYDAVGNRSQFTAAVEKRAAGEALLTVQDLAGAAVSDAQITATVTGTAADSHAAAVTVLGNGAYTVEYLGNGTYRVRLPVGLVVSLAVSHAGTVTATYNAVVVIATAPTYLETISLVPASATSGGATVTLSDAFNGQALPGVSLTLRAGINTAAGATVASGTTGPAGMYTFTGLGPGYYTAEMARSGYATGFMTVTVQGGTTLTYYGSIAPTVSTDQIRIILDWGLTPRDIDSHLTGPISGSSDRFHIWWFNQTYYDASGNLVAALDHDDTTSYGPETITLYRRAAGVYRYSVHDYSDRSATLGSFALSQSGARVRVYQGATLVAVFYVPVGREGTLWTVFELNGNVITPINTLRYESSVGSAVPDRSPAGASLIDVGPTKPRA